MDLPPKDRDDDPTKQFVRLLSEHERSLYAYILSLVPSYPDADDIDQETKVRLWEQFDRYDASRDFGAWARTIAHYEILHFRDRVKRSPLQFSQSLIEAVAQELQLRSDLLDRREDALALCLGKLGEKARDLLGMVYHAAQPMQEVAEQTGRTLNATYQAVWRIRRTLRECIDKRLAEEDDG